MKSKLLYDNQVHVRNNYDRDFIRQSIIVNFIDKHTGIYKLLLFESFKKLIINSQAIALF
jgi:hypothetical protein